MMNVITRDAAGERVKDSIEVGFCVAYTKCVASWHHWIYLFIHESQAPVT